MDEYDVPDDFKYIALAESGVENLTSPMSAVGFWQFLKATGKQYDLTINSEIDERYRVEKSTVAACKYLVDSYEKYGNWTLTAATYNMGKRGISKQLERQKATSYYNLVLSGDTTRYIPRAVCVRASTSQSKTVWLCYRGRAIV